MRHRCQRNQIVEIDRVFFIVNRVRIGCQRYIDLFASLCLEECTGHFVRRENRRGCTQLCTHVGDGRTLRNRQRCNARACVLDNFADAALDGHLTQYVQNNILCCNPGLQLTGQRDANHLRHRNVVCAAAHCDCDIQTACAECQHADTAAGWGVGVRTDQGLARCAEAFEVYLMADTVARLGVVDAVLLGHGADVLMVVRVLKTGL